MKEIGHRTATAAAWMVAFKLAERSIGLVSTVILARLLQQLGESEKSGFRFIQILGGKRFVLLAAPPTMLVAGFLFWMMSLSRLDLSYAYPLACPSALLVAVLSLGEVVTARMWWGAAMIVLGTVLLVPSR